ncbi:MAG: sugar transferase [Janthinobacterium lividum]
MKYTFPWRIFSVVPTDAGIQFMPPRELFMRLPAVRHSERVQRRLLDFSAALFLLLLCAPVLFWAAIAVKLSTPGPVLYRQKRVGRGGRIFEIWKFRTMFTGPQSGPCVTAQDDTRITPLGKYLRSWKLDELPQLFNVIRGEMSLVGPRPQVPRFVDCFDARLRRIILSVRPGMTGPTALYFRHEEFLLAGIADRECFYVKHLLPIKMQMDAEYVRIRTLRDDLGILADTLHLVVSRLTGQAGRSGIAAVCDMAELTPAKSSSEENAEFIQLAELERATASKMV